MEDRETLSSMLIVLLPQLIREIAKNEKITIEEAMEELYNSEVYSKLDDEETKLWHLSPKALYVLYKEEKETGKVVYPEEN